MYSARRPPAHRFSHRATGLATLLGANVVPKRARERFGDEFGAKTFLKIDTAVKNQGFHDLPSMPSKEAPEAPKPDSSADPEARGAAIPKAIQERPRSPQEPPPPPPPPKRS